MKWIDIPNDPADIPGGYLVMSTVPDYYDHLISGFVTEEGLCFELASPKVASEAEVQYIQDRFLRIEDALFAEGGVDPETGVHWRELLDENTFLHRYLQAEITADSDCFSIYFYKDADRRDPQVYCGPVWDQDNIWGANYKRLDPAVIYAAVETHRHPRNWFPAAMTQPDFQAAVRRTFREVYAPAMRILLGEETDPSGTLRSLADYAEEVAASAAMDNLRWPIPETRSAWTNLDTGDTPEENLAFLQDYIRRRLAFLEQEWAE